MFNLVAIIKVEDEHGNISCVCFTSGGWDSDANMWKLFPSRKPWLNIICGNDKYNGINKGFARICREIGFIPKDGN